MSMQPSFQSKDWNPFSAAASFIGSLGNKSKDNVNYQRAMMHTAANHESLRQHTEQQHSLGQQAADAEMNRTLTIHGAQTQSRTEHFNQGIAAVKQSGGTFNIADVSGSLPRPPKPTVSAPSTGRVPIKKNRGGRKVP